MSNYKTVPNQKIVKVRKEACNNERKENYYARINLAAMNAAALNLEAGAFKLWVYFAKNQDGYEFALSSKAVADTFGMKIKQYNNAVKALVDGGYLVITKGNNYEFRETPVNTKSNNAVITKEDNAVNTKSNNELLPEGIRNTTYTTNNITKDKTEGEFLEPSGSKISLIGGEEAEVGSIDNPIVVSREWLADRYNLVTQLKDGLFMYAKKFYRMAV